LMATMLKPALMIVSASAAGAGHENAWQLHYRTAYVALRTIQKRSALCAVALDKAIKLLLH
jgi:hypothetical protein